jgi:LCP family protein required for cell wall assembly
MATGRRSAAPRIHGNQFDDEPETVQTNGVTRAAANPTPTRRKRPSNPRKASSPAATVVAIVVLVFLMAAGCYAGYLYRDSQALRRYLPSFVNQGDIQTVFPGRTAINLMIVGRDYDYNNQDQVIRTHARSDMLMVARIDFVAKTAQLLSIPRDTAAAIPGHGVDKINAAHAFGGPALAEMTIARNFGIPVDHYVALDFDGFQQAIDLLGGVNCTVDKKMDYDDNWGHLHIHLLPGYQHLDGEQAMDFVRFRHSDSDLVRIKRQQALLQQLKQKLVDPNTLVVLPKLLDTIDTHVDSDLTPGQKVALAEFLHGLPQSSVRMTTLPSIEGGELVQTDYANAAPVVKSIFGVDMPTPVQTQTASSLDKRRHHHRRRTETT